METFVEVILITGVVIFIIFLLMALVKALMILIPLILLGIVAYFIIAGFLKGA